MDLGRGLFLHLSEPALDLFGFRRTEVQGAEKPPSILERIDTASQDEKSLMRIIAFGRQRVRG